MDGDLTIQQISDLSGMSARLVGKSIKRGDLVQVYKNNSIRGTLTQDKRTVFDLSFSDKFETNLYSGNGIDETNFNIIKTQYKIKI